MTPATRHRLFRTFKYGIYCLLAVNIAMFFREEWTALTHTVAGPLTLSRIIDLFPATIDTAAWVVLLLLFELETCVIPDERIKGRLKWSLHGVRAFSYVFIVYAFYGYINNCVEHYQLAALQIDNLCTLADHGYSWLLDLDEYELITSANCAELVLTTPLHQLTAFDGLVIANDSTLRAVQKLAWVDVINAGDWILVVVVLEADVRLQLKGALTGRVFTLSKVAKALVYSVLLICAVYWGFKGDFLDFWDAFLWLVAFVFIEMNVFQWQAHHKDI